MEVGKLRENFTSVQYVDDGQEVWIPFQHKGWNRLLRCTVTCAAGNHARVENKSRGIEKWFHIGELYKRKKDKLIK